MYYVSVCVCVCMRAREGDRDRDRDTSTPPSLNTRTHNPSPMSRCRAKQALGDYQTTKQGISSQGDIAPKPALLPPPPNTALPWWFVPVCAAAYLVVPRTAVPAAQATTHRCACCRGGVRTRASGAALQSPMREEAALVGELEGVGGQRGGC